MEEPRGKENIKGNQPLSGKPDIANPHYTSYWHNKVAAEQHCGGSEPENKGKLPYPAFNTYDAVINMIYPNKQA